MYEKKILYPNVISINACLCFTYALFSLLTSIKHHSMAVVDFYIYWNGILKYWNIEAEIFLSHIFTLAHFKMYVIRWGKNRQNQKCSSVVVNNIFLIQTFCAVWKISHNVPKHIDRHCHVVIVTKSICNYIMLTV